MFHFRARKKGMSGKEKPFPKARRSASADAALRAEIRRAGKMTIEQRMSAALSMGRGLPGVSKSAGGPPVDRRN
jgi:hypothetical protein